MKISRIYYFLFWYHPFFKVSPLKKLTSIFANSFPISNFLSSQLYNIFAIYFFGNSSFLKSFSSAIFKFSCHLTSVLIFSSNSTTAFLAFSKCSSFPYILLYTVNLFHHTKYFTTSFIFLLFKFFFIFHSLTSSTSTSFTSSIFCLSTCSLYTLSLYFWKRKK